MRILQVSDGYPPATGGLERTVQALARQLTERGHIVEVATLSYPGAAAQEQEDGAPGSSDGSVTVRRLQGFTRHLQRFSSDPGHHFHPTTADPQLVRRLQEVVAVFRPDVVHAHGWMLNSCLSLRLPAGCALVTTLHDYGLTCAKKTLVHRDELDRRCPGPTLARCLPCAGAAYGTLKGTALTLGLRERSRRLDRVSMFLPISRAVAEASIPGVPAERRRVVPSFVEDDLAEVAARTPRPDFLPEGDFLLFVGALGEHKGLTTLGQAQRQMRHAVPLVLIGTPRADTRLPVGTEDRPVIARTDLPHPQIMAAWSAATVGVVPSRWAEPQGLVAVEAMSTGLPVVASRVGGLTEIVTDGHTGLLVPPGDADALAGALDRLLDDSVLRGELGAHARIAARAYTAEQVIPQVLDAYAAARALA